MPPFKSKAQAKYMFAKHPEIAKEFANHTGSIKKLPEHVKKTRPKKGNIMAKSKSSGKMGMAHEKAEMRHHEAMEHMHKGKKKSKKGKK